MAVPNGLTPAQLSLAWLRQKADRLGVTCVPIPGTTQLAYARSNLAAANAPQLSDAEMERLEALGATVAGARGDEKYLQNGVEGVSARTGA
jgi:aryl-alcohol dehydrogenase-like predicted oxidoreductase